MNAYLATMGLVGMVIVVRATVLPQPDGGCDGTNSQPPHQKTNQVAPEQVAPSDSDRLAIGLNDDGQRSPETWTSPTGDEDSDVIYGHNGTDVIHSFTGDDRIEGDQRRDGR